MRAGAFSVKIRPFSIDSGMSHFSFKEGQNIIRWAIIYDLKCCFHSLVGTGVFDKTDTGRKLPWQELPGKT